MKLLLTLSLLFVTSLAGQTHERPKLVIAIVVDQMRADYLDRFSDLFHDGGFRMLMDHGARFVNCNYMHAPTNTAPGHSVFLSGIPPGKSGIISNDWYSIPLGRKMYCVEDSTVSGVGIEGSDPAGWMSPRNFHGTTLCDELTRLSPSSKTFAIAIKDRGSILPAGQRPSGAYWFDAGSGNWITSLYYRHELPFWVAKFNGEKISESYLGRSWNKVRPESAYKRAGEDNAPGEGTLPGETDPPVFPHRVHDLSKEPYATTLRSSNLKKFDALLLTPFGNEMTVKLAESAIVGEELGRRGVTDILSVSFSSPDYCGHTFGPDSHEMEDMYVQLDSQLAGFFTFVDEHVGLKNVTIVMTGDHGVAPLPERSPGAGRIDAKDVLTNVKVRIGQKFGYNEGDENLILACANEYFYLDTAKIRQHGFGEEEFEKAVGEMALKEAHMAAFYTRTQLQRIMTAGGVDDAYENKIRAGFDPLLSGHVALIVEPRSFFTTWTYGTTHSTGYEYDTHVPLLFYGAGIRPGTYSDACAPNDISATVAMLLGIRVPEKSTGKPLLKIMQ